MRTRRLRQIAVVVAVCSMSAAYGASQSPRTMVGVIGGILVGASIGFIITIAEIQVRDVYARQLRVIPAPVMFILRTLFYGACFVLVPQALSNLIREFDPNVDFSDLFGGRSILKSFGFGFVVNFIMALRRMMGTKRMIALATGRYHRAKEEERVVAFVDLKGSTHLAEVLGAARYHEFLNEILFDLADPIMQSGAEVYQYVGDEVVVTWRAEAGLKNGACLLYPFAIEDLLTKRRDAYIRDYGVAPAYRGALHIGPLMVGEIGDLNRQIVMIGDTMNTTARIEGACRKFSRDYIASAPLLARIGKLPEGLKAESLGPVPLAGKAGELELFALVRG